jgi:hypothetical protein
MKEKLYHHFLKFGPRRFVIFTVLILISLDLVNCRYLQLSWQQNRLAEKMVELSIQNLKLTPEDFSPETVVEMTGLMTKTFDFFLFLIILNNLFFYFFYLRKKLWAQGYILFYTLTAALFSFTLIFDRSMGMGWIFFNISTIPIYVYLYLGVKFLKDDTILIQGKRGQ